MLGVYIPDEMPVDQVIGYVARNGLVQFTVRWDECELSKGVYTWPFQLDLNISALRNIGCRFIINIKTTPEWARKYSGYLTSPPKSENYIDFANFINALITKYGTSLFYAVSLFNEPDTVRQELAQNWKYFGAWIEGDNVNQGGKDYAEMTKIVYPIVKARFPGVFVHVGELMYTTHKHFLDDAISDGLIGDVLAFHCYPRFEWMAQYGTSEQEILDWAFTQFITSIQSISSLPLFMSETALLYTNVNDLPAKQLQAKLYEYMSARLTWDWKIVGFNWFFLGGLGYQWENSQMIAMSGEKKPVYNRYQELALQRGKT